MSIQPLLEKPADEEMGPSFPTTRVWKSWMPQLLHSSEAKRQPYRSTMGVIVEDDWFVLNAMAVCDCEAYLWLYRDPINGTYDAVVKERWRNSGTSLLIPVSEWLSLGRITFWLACCINLIKLRQPYNKTYETLQ